jgi:DNA-binding NarL/FixJ family response regulator
MTTVAIVARRAATRSALEAVLAQDRGMTVTSSAPELDDAVDADVVVIEDSAAGDAGRLPAFVVVGMEDHPGFAQRARAAGAAAYVRLDEASERLGRAVQHARSTVSHAP